MNKQGNVRDSKVSQFEGILQLRINPGSDLLAGIEEGLKKHNVTSGVFLSGLGALKKAVFRNLRVFPEKYPVLPEHRLYYVVDKPLELLSVSGWVGQNPDGATEVHAHISASYVEGEKVVAVGGHLMEGVTTSIKVIVAIGVLAGGTLRTSFDDASQSLDLDLSQ